MKTKNKFLSAVMATLLCTVTAATITACSNGNSGATGGDEKDGWTLQTAYSTAKELGYDGSLDEFLETIKGKDGKNGENGKDGVSVTDVAIKDGHLIVTLSNKEVIDCGEITSSSTSTPTTCKHNFSEWKIAIEPTCEQKGIKYSTCSVCELSKVIEIDELGHTKSQNWVADGDVHIKACETCGKTLEEESHDYEGYTCEVCDHVKYSRGLVYYIDDGKAIIRGIGTCGDYDLRIPAEIDGCPVVKIDDNAFAYCVSIRSVVIPDSVTSIGDSAFEGCAYLTSVTIPESVTSIGDGAFYFEYLEDSLTIYCEADSKPAGWSDNWVSSSDYVVWGYKG